MHLDTQNQLRTYLHGSTLQNLIFLQLSLSFVWLYISGQAIGVYLILQGSCNVVDVESCDAMQGVL